MLKFHCDRCKESFNIAIENLYNKESIVCNNCGFSLPDEAVSALKEMSIKYMDAIDVLKKTGEHEQCWSISMVGEERLVPPPTQEFEKFNFDYRETKKQSYWKHRQTPIVYESDSSSS